MRRARALLCLLLVSCATAQVPVEPSVLPTALPTLHSVEPSGFVATLRTDDGYVLIDPETHVRTSLVTPNDGTAESMVMLPHGKFVVTTTNAAYLGAGASGQYERLSERPPEMSVVASDDAGRTLVWYRALADNAGEYYLSAPGQSERMLFASVDYPGEATVSEDGRYAAVSGTVPPCTVLRECPMSIWVWRFDTGQLRTLATTGRAAYKPQFITGSNGATWLYYQTTSYDASPRCETNINACAHTIVRRRAEGGPETIVARHAFAFAAGRDGVTAYLSHDAPGCSDNVQCGALRLHVVDVRGDRVVAEPATTLRPRAFSPDGRWLLFRDENNIINALRLRTGEVEPLGEGFPLGWRPSD